jgi:hypothetical protein
MASAVGVAVAGAFSRSMPKRCTKLYLDDDSFPLMPTTAAAPTHRVRLDAARHYRCAQKMKKGKRVKEKEA